MILWVDSLFGRLGSHCNGVTTIHGLPPTKNGAELAAQIGRLWHAHRDQKHWQILVNVGPGSFTGLKVGLGTVHAVQDWLAHQGIALEVSGLRSTVALWLGAGARDGETAALSANPGRAYAETCTHATASRSEVVDTQWSQLHGHNLCLATQDQAAATQAAALGISYRDTPADTIARAIMERASSRSLSPWLVAPEPCYVRQPRIDTSNDWRQRMLGWDSTDSTPA